MALKAQMYFYDKIMPTQFQVSIETAYFRAIGLISDSYNYHWAPLGVVSLDTLKDVSHPKNDKITFTDYVAQRPESVELCYLSWLGGDCEQICLVPQRPRPMLWCTYHSFQRRD